MAKPILDSFLGLTLGTASDTINAQMVNLSGYDSSLFYSEVLLKLRLAAEWAQRALGTDFPDELLEYLFYWYFY